MNVRCGSVRSFTFGLDLLYRGVTVCFFTGLELAEHGVNVCSFTFSELLERGVNECYLSKLSVQVNLGVHEFSFS